MRRVYEIYLPSDDFLFWDTIGRLADAFAKLALEDPLAKCLNIMWTFDPYDRKIRIPHPGVMLFEKEGVRYYIFPSNSLKTIVLIHNPREPIPFKYEIVDESTLEELHEDLVLFAFSNL